MPEHVTHKELNKQFDKHTEKCDTKINKQVEYRHELANDISTRISGVESHIDDFKDEVNKNNTAMLDKFNKMYVSITHISDVIKHLADSYKKLWDEFSEHMRDETLDRKELIDKLDSTKESSISKTLFWYAVIALVTVLWVWAWLISYAIMAVVDLEKDSIETITKQSALKATQAVLIEKIDEIEKEIK